MQCRKSKNPSARSEHFRQQISGQAVWGGRWGVSRTNEMSASSARTVSGVAGLKISWAVSVLIPVDNEHAGQCAQCSQPPIGCFVAE